ncbi:hypothetical protein pEaSNUABM44_00118 [Erwinia phage pEa_SNUABM_44]|nr:hypothetical protein pEaSNUABM44_00118 [Erwinia phage pEa_SNUABM_44]
MIVFIIIGMVLLFLFGLAAIIGSVIIPMYVCAWTGKVSKGEIAISIIMFVIGSFSWYYVFSHMSLNIGIS